MSLSFKIKSVHKYSTLQISNWIDHTWESKKVGPGSERREYSRCEIHDPVNVDYFNLEWDWSRLPMFYAKTDVSLIVKVYG